jgi:alanine dehydrogenase
VVRLAGRRIACPYNFKTLTQIYFKEEFLHKKRGKAMLKVISKKDIEKLIDMKQVIILMEKAFADYSLGKIEVPLRTKIRVDKNNGDILFMPAYLSEENALGVKIVSVYPDNREKSMQTIFSTLMLNDSKTGEPIALMDAEVITAFRTGAVTGAAAKYLSNIDSRVVSLFGAGIQARAQIEAIYAVRNIEKVYVFSLNKDRLRNFCLEMSEKLKIVVVEGTNQKEALEQSDIIITATTSSTPVFNGEYVKMGTFISSVGSFTSTMQEIPDEIVVKASIIVDTYNSALKEAGDLVIPLEKGIISKDSIRGELGDVILNKISRQSKDEVIFFKSVGLAFQDMCVAPKIYEKAVALGIGNDVEV